MVTIYTTLHCPYCKMAKDYFNSHNVAFTEKDVENDEAARDEMMKRSGGLSVPVIDIDGSLVIGFDRDAIDHLLGQSTQ